VILTLTPDYGRGDQGIHPQPLQRRVPPCASRPSYLLPTYCPLNTTSVLPRTSSRLNFCRRPQHVLVLRPRRALLTLTSACSVSRASGLLTHPCSQTKSAGTLSQRSSLSPKRQPILSKRVRKPGREEVGWRFPHALGQSTYHTCHAPIP
jgi:hypothetical protein